MKEDNVTRLAICPASLRTSGLFRAGRRDPHLPGLRHTGGWTDSIGVSPEEQDSIINHRCLRSE